MIPRIRSILLSFAVLSLVTILSLFLSVTHPLSLVLPFSCSTRIGLRRTSIARGSELSSEIAIRLDFFSGVTFFPSDSPWSFTVSRRLLSVLIVPFPFLSHLICLSPFLFICSNLPEKNHLLRSRDFVASTTVASRTLGSLHASTPFPISSVSISIPLNPTHPPTLPPRFPTWTDPRSRDEFREVRFLRGLTLSTYIARPRVSSI